MGFLVSFYDVGNCCICTTEFIVGSIKELNEKAREFAESLVGEGYEIAGWNYE